MTNRNSLGLSRIAGVFLVLGNLASLIGAAMWRSDPHGYLQGLTYHAAERSFFIAAVILTAVGFVLLEDSFATPTGRALVRIGAAGYFFGAILLVAGEVLTFTIREESAFVLIAVYMIMAYLAQASIGGALLQSRITAAWIGWATILWNLWWLLVIVSLGWAVGYISIMRQQYTPVYHHLMPLVIGIALLWKARRPEAWATDGGPTRTAGEQ